MKRLFTIAIVCLITFVVTAQPVLKHHTSDIKVFKQGKELLHPWTGGLSNPVFSEFDVNNDGIQDIYLYDVNGAKSLVFLHDGVNGINGYHYSPSYDSTFHQKMYGYALMRDFNCDGNGDLFYYRPPFISVDSGYIDGNGEIAYKNYLPSLRFYNSGWQGIAGSAAYLPAIDDFNEDGDLDILTWDQQGSFLWLYQNLSVENGLGCDSLYFDDVTHCWGRIQDDKLNPRVNLQVACKNKRGSGPRHLGWTTSSFDQDCDLDKEILIGDSGYDNLIMLDNEGDTSFANVFVQDTIWPKNHTKVKMPLWPSSAHVDVDHDGLRDVLVAPFHVSNGVDGSVDTNNVWYYRNTGTTCDYEFQFQQDEYLIGDMVDVGTGAYPTIVDVNGDSLLDLVVGNVGYFTGSPDLEARLMLLTNIGTPTEPKFEITNKNWLNIPSRDTNTTKHIAPTFGDIDQDGDDDMLMGELLGTLWFFENIAGQGNPMVFNPPVKNFQGIDVGLYAAPQLIDLTGDTLVDLVIGENKGIIKYYENTGGVGNPVFTLTSDSIGGLNVRQQYPNPYASGYAAPHFCELDSTGKLYLLVGCQEGRVYLYDSILGNLNGSFRLLDTTYHRLDEGSWSVPAAADLDGDGIAEVIIGNRRGGLTLMGMPGARSFFTILEGCQNDPIYITDESSYADSVKYYYYDSMMNLTDSSGDIPSYSFGDTNKHYIRQVAFSPRGNDTSTVQVQQSGSPAVGTLSHTIIDTGVAQFTMTRSNTNVTYVDYQDGKKDTNVTLVWTHEFDSNGTYMVEVVLEGNCGNDTLYEEVVIMHVDIRDQQQLRRLEASVVPNPGYGKSDLLINSGLSGIEMDLRVLTIEGRELHNDVLNLEQGSQRYHLPHLKDRGIYLIQLTSKNSTRTLKYIVQ